MSNDCRLWFPPGARVRDVAMVIGRLLGCDAELVPIGGGSSAARVGDMRVEPICGMDPPMAECCHIRGETPTPGWESVWTMYHFEPGGAENPCPGSTLIMPSSRPQAIAVCRGLVDFFGGWLDYDDCDEFDLDYVKPPRDPIAPSDGVEWDDFQRAIVEVQPLTRADFEACVRWAAYKDALR